MKLELKHLAAYIPYDLKVYMTVTKKIEKLYELKTYINNKNDELFSIVTNSGNISDSYIMPILRPLTDLTKEILIEDTKLIPIVELLKIEYSQYYIQNFGNHYSKIEFDDNFPHAWFKLMATKEIKLYNDVKKYPYWIFDTLLSWHFDLFGLIESELAIDANKV